MEKSKNGKESLTKFIKRFWMISKRKKMLLCQELLAERVDELL